MQLLNILKAITQCCEHRRPNFIHLHWTHNFRGKMLVFFPSGWTAAIQPHCGTKRNKTLWSYSISNVVVTRPVVRCQVVTVIFDQTAACSLVELIWLRLLEFLHPQSEINTDDFSLFFFFSWCWTACGANARLSDEWVWTGMNGWC